MESAISVLNKEETCLGSGDIQNVQDYWQDPAEAEAERMRLSVDEQLECLNAIEIKEKGKLAKAFERGMATAEYAVGILAAVAMALVLLKIITGKDFFGAMLKFVVSLIAKVGAQLP